VKVFVNDREVTLMPGKHALTAAGLIQEIERGKKVYDEMGNEIGLGGSITEGSRMYVK
jgi:hypothetical protein